MKALRLTAKWQPRPGFTMSALEVKEQKVSNASQAWRCPELHLCDIDVPEIEDDEVLIRVRACGVCGSDTHCFETDESGYVLFSGMAHFPITLGHEFSGEVVQVGKRVTSLRTGDKVASESCMWCGICMACRAGNVNQCERMELLGLSVPGAFAEFVAVKEKHCWKLDPLTQVFDEDEVFELGALIEPVGCAYNGMFITTGGFQPGAYVAVFGAGPIGLAAVMLAKAAGAAKVFAFDRNESRNRLALIAGADYAGNPHTLTAQGTSPAAVLLELTGGHGMDLMVEAAGAASETIPEMSRAFAPNGKLVFLGRRDTRAEIDFNPIVSRANLVAGARGHAGLGIYPNVIRLLAARRLPALSMITARFDFDKVIAAIGQSATRVDGKVMVRI